MKNDQPNKVAELIRDRRWEDPIPLDDDSESISSFPIETLPRALQDLVSQSSEAVGCPVDYAAAHALGVAAGAIGASFDLQVKRGYQAPVNLWICVVAPPGSGKSPAVAPILNPVFKEHALRSREETIEEKGQVWVGDVTVEKLTAMLQDNHRGLTMIWDEMAGWLTGFNQYKTGGKGNDRSHYLSIWDGRPTKVDRKGKDAIPVTVRRPRLSVVGGIQPEVLDELRAGPSDGLFDRMLFAFPPDPGMTIETWAEVDDAPIAAWERALRGLWDVAMKQDEITKEKRPNIIRLNEDARSVWTDWTKEMAEKAADPEAPMYFRSVGTKVKGYAARLALVIHRLREVYCDPPGDGVGAEDMRRGVVLGRYFLEHAERVHQAAGRDVVSLQAKAILRWAIGHESEQWTPSELWKSVKNNTLFGDHDDLDKPLRRLEAHQMIRTLVPSERRGPGRPTLKGTYELNPALRKRVSGDNQKV